MAHSRTNQASYDENLEERLSVTLQIKFAFIGLQFTRVSGIICGINTLD